MNKWYVYTLLCFFNFDKSQIDIKTVNTLYEDIDLLTLDKATQEHFVCEGEKVKCLVENCKRQLKLNRMRLHIGKHILKEELEEDHHLCGYCGKVGCSLRIYNRSGVWCCYNIWS